MGCQKLLNNSKLFAIASGIKHQPLAIAYKRENKLSEKSTSHGNTFSMPHSGIKWDFADRLRQASNGTFTSYYNYNSSGERSRKVVEKGNIREERYYIGGYEVFRKYVNGSLDTERQTLHVDDDNKKVALVDTLTIENGTPCSPGVAEVRYQYDNHLGSACLELDEYADIISYEEYHPFGTTSYRSGRTETEVSLKRYKYVGKERDEETGLYYYGARYYAAWLCRFVSVDPLQHEYPDLTPYQYASNSPVSYIDLDGLEKANTAFNINDMLNQAAKRFAPVQDNIKPNTPSSVKKMEVEAQKAEKAKKKEEYQNTTQYKENAKSIQQASANALFPNGTPLAFDITNKTLSHTSTAVSTFQVITQQMNKSFIMGNNGMLFKKIADPRLAFVQGQVLKEGKLKLLDGKMVKMTNDIENLNKNFGTLDNIGISINAASSVFVGLETYNKTGKMEEAMGAGAINFALNWNPTVSVIYTFGSAVANTDEFKQQMFKYWESKMNEYRNTDLKLYNNAANNYNKYYNELGIIKEPINAQIKQAD